MMMLSDKAAERTTTMNQRFGIRSGEEKRREKEVKVCGSEEM